MLVEGFPVSLGVVVGVVVAVAGAFVFSLPMLHAPVDRTMLASHPRSSIGHVRRVFRDYGVRLRYASHPRPGLTVLGAGPPPWPATGLYVSVTRDGLVTVHYGGSNTSVRARVEGAEAALGLR
jgi:hypothetical protein